MALRLLQGSKGHLIILDYAVLFLATFLNCLALIGTLNARFVLRNYRRYLLNIVASNLYLCAIHAVIFINQGLTIYEIAPNIEHQKCAANFLRSLLLFGIFANFFTLIGMSIEHYIGIMYPLRYGCLIEKPAARNSIWLIWSISLLLSFGDIVISSVVFLVRQSSGGNVAEPVKCGLPNFSTNFSQFPTQPAFISSFQEPVIGLTTTVAPYYNNNANNKVAMPKDFLELLELHAAIVHSQITKASAVVFSCLERHTTVPPAVTWCGFILENKIWHEAFSTVFTVSCFFLLTFLYGRIIKQMVRKNRRIFREWILTTVLLLGAFIICWLPFMLLEFVAVIFAYRVDSRESFSSSRLIFVHNIFHSIFLMFPLLDPILHVTRVSAVRKYFKSWRCCGGQKSEVKASSSLVRLSQRNNVRRRVDGADFLVVMEGSRGGGGDQLRDATADDPQSSSNLFRVVSDGTQSPDESHEDSGATPLGLEGVYPPGILRNSLMMPRTTLQIAKDTSTSGGVASEWLDDHENVTIANDIYNLTKAWAALDQMMAAQYITVV